MKLASVEIENFRAIEKLTLALDPRLTVLHGANAHGKTSVLGAIAVGLGTMTVLFPGATERTERGFLDTDLRVGASGDVFVYLTTVDDISWSATITKGQQTQRSISTMTTEGQSEQESYDALADKIDEIRSDHNGERPTDLPIIAFYDTDRVIFDRTERWPDIKKEFTRYDAFDGALSSRTNFQGLFEWFYRKENEELREQRERRDFGHQIRDLSSVRHAISSMLDDVSDPYMEMDPPRFMVSIGTKPNGEKLALDQLSGGCRAVLALAADLAWRMAQGNPHLDNPLESEAIVLIDEVDLHLHPSWQQRILNDLSRTFPNAQFVVSTHSPQVLTTVRPEHIVELYREEDGRVVAGSPASATYGAEAGDVLSSVMGTNQRPRDNEFTDTLERYMRLIGNGEGESEEALALRNKLEDLSPRDHALDRADVEIRRRALLERMGKST